VYTQKDLRPKFIPSRRRVRCATRRRQSIPLTTRPIASCFFPAILSSFLNTYPEIPVQWAKILPQSENCNSHLTWIIIFYSVNYIQLTHSQVKKNKILTFEVSLKKFHVFKSPLQQPWSAVAVKSAGIEACVKCVYCSVAIRINYTYRLRWPRVSFFERALILQLTVAEWTWNYRKFSNKRL